MKKESKHSERYREKTVGESFPLNNVEVPFGAVVVN